MPKQERMTKRYIPASQWRKPDRESDDTYNIVRFRFKKPRRVLRSGLTLEEAQAHCNDPATHGADWFDGYEKE